jgi:polysaccharide biosynthesis PFTS motif protein
LPNWLGGQILENLSNHSSLINTPLPNKWFNILIENKFKINKIACNIKFYIIIIFTFIANLKLILKIIHKSLTNKSNIINNSVHFINLKSNNLPPNLTNKNYDLISWYIESKAFIKGIKYIYHDVYDSNPLIYNSINIQSNELPIITIKNRSKIFTFTLWAIQSFIIALFDLLRGNWWHALILGEAAKNKVVELTDKHNLSIAYYFPYSSECYRPMWTYTAFTKGVDIISFFYSTFEQPTSKYSNSNQKFEFYLYNWPKSLLWDENQLSLLQKNTKFKINEFIVGPVWTVDSKETLKKYRSFTIVVFDTQIHKKYYHFGVSTLADYYEKNPNVNLNFLKDIVLIADMFDINVIHKTKRNIGYRTLNSYDSLLKKLNKKLNYQQYDSSISPLKLIENANIVISSPFTSTALFAKNLNKPSFFYDPSSWVQKNDSASHDIPIIHGFNELKQQISEIYEKN